MVKRVFLKDLRYIEDMSISEMSVFTEIESSKVCDTFRTVTHRVFRVCGSPLDMFYVILYLIIVYEGFL